MKNKFSTDFLFFNEINGRRLVHYFIFYCLTKIDMARQEEIFRGYYENSNKTKKTLIIRAGIKKNLVTSRKNHFMPIVSQKNREHTFEYF